MKQMTLARTGFEKHARPTRKAELLQQNGLRLSGGTIVDATLIAAPPSVKNRDKARDPQMHQTKKGNQWHFGMKLHIGVDSGSGLIHSASVTPANVHDRHEVPNLLQGNETRFYGDRAYRGKEQRERLREIAPRARDFTNRRAYRNAPLSDTDRETNRRKSAVRSKVEHPFLTLKRWWGFAKVRYGPRPLPAGAVVWRRTLTAPSPCWR